MLEHLPHNRLIFRAYTCSMKRIISMALIALSLVACNAPAQVSQVVHAVQPFPAHTFDHIFVIIFENKSPAEVMRQPYFSALAKRGVQLTNYRGITHPSQPNYIALVAGDPLVRDNFSHNLSQRNLADLMEEAGVSWKTYVEAYPGNCFNGGSYKGLYARKHNPLISFDSVRNDPQRCAKIVNADQLNADIAGDALPQFSLYVPDMNNSAHDKPISYADAWLKTFLEPKLADHHFMRNTLAVITFDEGFSTSNAVYAVLLSDKFSAGKDDAPYTHYSLLRTIEDNFTLKGRLTRNDTSAAPFDVDQLLRQGSQ